MNDPSRVKVENYCDPQPEVYEFRRKHMKGSDGINRPDGKIAKRIAGFRRNSQCPCGSGKKYKKCCIGKL